MSARKLLGRDMVPALWILIGYRAVFEIEDGLEVDEINMAAIERTRVYFDDVVGITFHKTFGAGYLIVTGLCSWFFGAIAVAFIGDAESMGGVIMAGATVPFIAAFVLRVILKMNVITVFGRRTMAVIKIPLRSDHATQIYRDLTEKIRACQEKAAAAMPKPAPPPAPPPPPAV